MILIKPICAFYCMCQILVFSAINTIVTDIECNIRIDRLSLGRGTDLGQSVYPVIVLHINNHYINIVLSTIWQFGSNTTYRTYYYGLQCLQDKTHNIGSMINQNGRHDNLTVIWDTRNDTNNSAGLNKIRNLTVGNIHCIVSSKTAFAAIDTGNSSNTVLVLLKWRDAGRICWLKTISLRR